MSLAAAWSDHHVRRDGNFKRYPRRDIIPLAIKGSEAGGGSSSADLDNLSSVSLPQAGERRIPKGAEM